MHSPRAFYLYVLALSALSAGAVPIEPIDAAAPGTPTVSTPPISILTAVPTLPEASTGKHHQAGLSPHYLYTEAKYPQVQVQLRKAALFNTPGSRRDGGLSTVSTKTHLTDECY